MPLYLRLLRDKFSESEFVTSVAIADALNLNAIVVKKDLAAVASAPGVPNVGFSVKTLRDDIEEFLGYNNTTDAVLVGAGNLGSALLSYGGFANCGLNIAAAFDADERLFGKVVSGKRILPVDKFENLVKRLKIRIGIITVPGAHAQNVCDLMVRAGIKAIWNFAPAHLTVPNGVALKNEDLSVSLAVLSNDLKKITEKNGDA
jgi:redox-sensing transcriptional repressor